MTNGINESFSDRQKDKPYFDAVLELFDKSKFEVPQAYSVSYFPDFLDAALDGWVDYYQKNYMQIFQAVHWLPEQSQWRSMLESIGNLAENIKVAVNQFYKGNVLKATSAFNQSLDNALYKDISLLNSIPSGSEFFRGRAGENRSYRKAELFHVPFEKRHLIASNRYSIPGLPALYLGGSTHLCWAELGRSRFRDMVFSRFENKKALTVIRIQRLEDFLESIPKNNTDDQKLAELSQYLITYPLTIACSIKVKESECHFKPEYIIPQLLLQYVAEQDNIDGIVFPSTQIDYSAVKAVASYNYVFPVKSSQKEGYCPVLAERFHLTEPTSLEIEEMSYNRKFSPGFVGAGDPGPGRLELTKGILSPYRDTAFGRIEQALKVRSTNSLLPY